MPVDSGVCAISPSDLVGYDGNLISEVRDLRQRVSELEAGNIEVNQLSDLSQQVGWVGGVEYLGTSGWTQTSYGTLLPPPGVSFSSLGFTLSDGNTYQLVMMDANGVLQYGFRTDGIVAGAQVTGSNYITLYTETKSSFEPVFSVQRSAGIFSSGSLEGNSTVRISKTGLYLISFSVDAGVPGASTVFCEFLARDASDVTQWQVINEQWNDNASTKSYGFSINQPLYLEAGWSVLFRFSSSITAIADCHGCVLKLG